MLQQKSIDSVFFRFPLACLWMQQVDPEGWRLRRVSIQAPVLSETEEGWWRSEFWFIHVHTINWRLKLAFSQLPFPTVFHVTFYWPSYNFMFRGWHHGDVPTQVDTFLRLQNGYERAMKELWWAVDEVHASSQEHLRILFDSLYICIYIYVYIYICI